MRKAKSLVIAGTKILPGETKSIDLVVGRTYDFIDMRIPIRVIRGKEPGPVLFVSAAVHGDEINGVEIIKRLLKQRALKKIKGTLIAIPIVNVFGFNHQSRYLPDRRDLNRCFPGSNTGPLASRIANLLMKEVVRKSTHGIDLHTGALHRFNLPQIRAYMNNKATYRFAEAFHVPVVINSKIRDGSLREAARKMGIPILVFEGGQALRFDENSIKIGLNGILSTMHKIGMLKKDVHARKFPKAHFAASSVWVRATQGGTLRMLKKLGSKVLPGDVLGVISDPFGERKVQVRSEHEGIIVGANLLPLVNQGDALFHVAVFHNVPSKSLDLLLYE